MKLVLRVVSFLSTLTLIVGASVAMATPATAASYDAKNDVFNTPFYFLSDQKTSGKIYKNRELCYDISGIFKNDSLGYDLYAGAWRAYDPAFPRTYRDISFSKPSQGKVSLNCGGYEDAGIWYTPAKAGVDSFTYTVADDDGAEHTATVTINGNSSFKNVVATPVEWGVKFYNPNNETLSVNVSGWRGLGGNRWTIFGTYKVKPKSSFTFVRTEEYLTENGKGYFEYQPLLPSGPYAKPLKTGNSDVLLYTSKYLKPKRDGIGGTSDPTKPSATVQPRGSGAKVSMKNPLKKAVRFKITYKKSSASKYRSSFRTVKASQLKRLTLKNLKKGSKVTVSYKLKSGKYKRLTSPRLPK